MLSENRNVGANAKYLRIWNSETRSHRRNTPMLEAFFIFKKIRLTLHMKYMKETEWSYQRLIQKYATVSESRLAAAESNHYKGYYIKLR